jgi:glyoxylase-like metal-dependent hydrolase (beta-lactamase superfamily II)
MEVHTFKIEKKVNEVDTVLFPSFLRFGDRTYLIDCGYKETFEDFQQELIKLNAPVNQLTGVFISHDDIDHLGGLDAFKKCNPNISVFCGAIEEQSVCGKVKSERLIQAENSLEHIPNEYKTWALHFIQSLQNIKRYRVDMTFNDGDEFEKGVMVIHTPGHTKGHVSLFVIKEKILIANDALVIENDEFEIANPNYTLDMTSAIKSVEKIRQLNPDKIICYHGGVMQHDVHEKLNRLLLRYKHKLI